MDELAIFERALDLNDPEERAAYVEDACGEDAELRQRIEALLRSHEQAGSFLQGGASDAAATIDQPITEKPGTVIGPYKLLQQIGEGGMGIVFVAERSKLYRQKVALKVIKPGMDSKSVMARFQAEQQTLALMDHPNIARVLDAGMTEHGRPYFVMELVRGLKITNYCDRHKLTIRERLELFVQVCQAAQHAHQKAIIHRDIKPSNVLVTEKDGRAIPKVIDFGIAKALNRGLLGHSVYTQFQQIMGTPLYMSPEQTGESAVDVDTRSDVYSLGVLLYELLTGTTPFTEQELKKAGDAEMLRIIRETVPPKPSTKINTLGGQALSVSENRRMEYSKLGRAVHGDLDWIVMKALEKERARRYETASAFAADVQRYLSDDAIEARPPSTAYRLRKSASRHRVALMATAAVMLALMAGVSVSTWQWRESVLIQVKLEQLVDVYLQELISTALIEATYGNEDRTRDAIEKVKDAGATEDVVEMLLGQVAFYGGKTDEAIEHLKRSIHVQHPSVAARAILAVAYAQGGYDRAYLMAMEDLFNCHPVTAQDFLFLGQAWVYADPSIAIEHVDEAIEMHDSALARVIRAEALTYVAINNGNRESLSSAMDDIRVATAFMPDNPYVAMCDLYVHLEALRFFQDTNELERLRLEAEAVAIRLESFPDYALGHLTRALYFDYMKDEARAAEEARATIDGGGKGYASSTCAAILYRYGEYDTAMKWLELDPGHESDVQSMFYAELLALSRASGDQKRALEIYGRLSNSSLRSPRAGQNARLIVPEVILLLVGHHDEAAKKCGEKLCLSDYRTDWEEKMLKYIGGKISRKELLANASRYQQTVAHRLIALRLLSEGQKEEAMVHFEECNRLVWLSPEAAWAAALLARMKDNPDWPGISYHTDNKRVSVVSTRSILPIRSEKWAFKD